MRSNIHIVWSIWPWPALLSLTFSSKQSICTNNRESIQICALAILLKLKSCFLQLPSLSLSQFRNLADLVVAWWQVRRRRSRQWLWWRCTISWSPYSARISRCRCRSKCRGWCSHIWLVMRDGLRHGLRHECRGSWCRRRRSSWWSLTAQGWRNIVRGRDGFWGRVVHGQLLQMIRCGTIQLCLLFVAQKSVNKKDRYSR
jgi:hypothetical protein